MFQTEIALTDDVVRRDDMEYYGPQWDFVEIPILTRRQQIELDAAKDFHPSQARLEMEKSSPKAYKARMKRIRRYKRMGIKG